MRSLATPPVEPTRRPVVKRSLVTQTVAAIRQPALKHSLKTQSATTTRQMALLRSIATQTAATTQPRVHKRLGIARDQVTLLWALAPARTSLRAATTSISVRPV